MATMTLAPFGLKDGRLVDISEVARGSACECFCPHCNAPLVARKGETKQAHFAHHPGTQACENAYETALHLMAKQILAEECRLRCLELIIEESMLDVTYHRWHESITVTVEQEVVFDTVKLEVAIADYRPDCILEKSGQPLWVEIKVTHGVSSEKKAYLHEHNIAGIEINLSNIKRLISKEELRGLLLSDVENMTWLHHPRTSSKRKQLKSMLGKRIEQINSEYARQQKKQYATPFRRLPSTQPNQHNWSSTIKHQPKGDNHLLCENCRQVFSIKLQNPKPSIVTCPHCARAVSTEPPT